MSPDEIEEHIDNAVFAAEAAAAWAFMGELIDEGEELLANRLAVSLSHAGAVAREAATARGRS